MKWSHSKQFCQKWYRIREYQNGDRDILEAEEQWSIEKGLGDDREANFDRYFKRHGQWYSQRAIKYRYLFLETIDLVNYGYEIERLDCPEQLDELFGNLKPIEEWVTYIEERISDCMMAIRYKEASIDECRAKIKLCLHKFDLNSERDILIYKQRIARLNQESEELKIEREQLINKLLEEEGIEW
jgi:hypothetical protein